MLSATSVLRVHALSPSSAAAPTPNAAAAAASASSSGSAPDLHATLHLQAVAKYPHLTAQLSPAPSAAATTTTTADVLLGGTSTGQGAGVALALPLPLTAANEVRAEFGAVLVGRKAERKLTLTNPSPVRATIRVRPLGREVKPVFFLLQPSAACSAALGGAATATSTAAATVSQAVIGPHSSLTLSVLYTPVSTGTYSCDRFELVGPALPGAAAGGAGGRVLMQLTCCGLAAGECVHE